MLDRQSLLAQLLMGSPRPVTRLDQLVRADDVDAMRQRLPSLPTPDTRAGKPNRMAELTMPGALMESRASALARLLNTPGIEAALTMTPVVGDVASLGYAARDASRGDWWGAGLNALGVLPMVPALGTMAGKARGAVELDYYGTPLRVLQNPSPREMAGFLGRSKYKAARRIIDPDTGDVYVWDAADPALHRMVAEHLGVPWRKNTVADIIGLD